MNFLETLYYELCDEPEPKTPEYQKNATVRHKLMDCVEMAMGIDMVDKITSAYIGHEDLECQRYFRYGVQLGLELLGLLV